jgi:peroxiredoxin
MRNAVLIFLLVLLAGNAKSVELTQPAPDFTLKSLAGENLRLKEYRGKVVLVNFWASWCGPCRQEMPILDKIHQRYAPMGFTVLGVNVDKKSDKARQIAERLDVSFPLLLDQQQTVSEQYQVSAMPYTLLVDRDGEVHYIHKGYKPGDEKNYIDRVRALLRRSNASTNISATNTPAANKMAN